MSNLARMLSPPYLLPRLRPSMPNRTMSNSDYSLTSPSSPRSDYLGDLVTSSHNTPMLACERPEHGRDGYQDGDDASPRNLRVPDNHVSAPDTPGSPRPHRCGDARPIVIELPQFKRFSTTPARTLLEPLSTQGEVPGDCFPFHEDPNSQVHGPYPGQHEADDKISGLIDESATVYTNSPTSHPVRSSPVAPSNAPVTSYFALGLYDSPLPIGKYYPSNFENRWACKPMLRPSLARALSSISPDGDTIPRSTNQSHLATPETELQRKLQQYQRDMIVQASIAVRELLNNPATSANYMANGVPINSLPLWNARLPAQTPHKPRPPRLLPMDSPGPVTPLDLGAVDGGDYLSK